MNRNLCSTRALVALLIGILALGQVHSALAQDGQAAPGFSTWQGDFEGMRKRRLVRMLVPFSKTIYFLDGGRQYGTAVDLGQALDEWLNKGAKKETDRIRIAYVPVPRAKLLEALAAGRGDIVSADLTVTPARQQLIDFSAPLAGKVQEVLVTGPATPAIASLDDLGGKEVFVRRTSSYHEHLNELNVQRRQAGKPEILVRDIDENLEDEDLLEMVNAGLLQWCVVDRFNARTWAQVYDQLKIREDIVIATGGEIAFGIRKDSPELKKMLDGFVSKHKVGTTFGNILRSRYYRSDKIIRAAHEPRELAKFQALRLIFDAYAKTYDFDALMLVAQGYQESQLDQSERSPRGAVGIMQLLPSTAADKAVGIAGIDKSAERNIEAGAKYLRHLSNTYVDEPGPSRLDRMLLSLAAYNAGPGNLQKFRKAAKEMNLNPDVWFGNVENGAAKIVGRETVQYVGNIYKYYVAYMLAARREAERTNAAPKP